MSLLYALDTNILSAIFNGEPNARQLLALITGWTQAGGGVGIHGSVYAELLGAPNGNPQDIDAFLSATAIRVDWTTSETLWKAAGAAYGTYALRRRRSGGGALRRILADFLIGAHAQQRGATLVTLDDWHYRRGFPGLRVFVP